MNGIKLIIFILSKGRGELLTRLCAEESVGFHVSLQGRGTVDSDIMRLLGMRDREKDIVFLSAEDDRAETLMRSLGEKLKLDQPGTGIAFTIPLSAVVSQFSNYEFMAGKTVQPAKKGRRRAKNERGEKTDD